MTIDVSQPAGAARAKGTFRLTVGSSGEVMDATEVGVLQTATKWASFTARARVRPSGDELPVLVIVDRADPFVDGHPTTVTESVDGMPRVNGVLQ